MKMSILILISIFMLNGCGSGGSEGSGSSIIPSSTNGITEPVTVTTTPVVPVVPTTSVVPVTVPTTSVVPVVTTTPVVPVVTTTPVVPASSIPKVMLVSKPTNSSHPGVYYTTPVVIKIVNQYNSPVIGVKPLLTFNDEGWVLNSQLVTDAQGNISYTWAPGQSNTPSFTVSYNNSSVTVTGITVPWPSNIPYLASNLQNNLYSLNATGIQRDLTPLTEPNRTYYAVHQWDGGYTGLQKGGARYDRQLQFSVWNGSSKTIVINQGSSICVPFDTEGSGIKCENTYPWVVGGTYRFTVTTITGSGYKDITSVFTDVSNGAIVNLGTLRYFTTSESIFNSAISFIEDFNSEHNCFAVEDRSAIFSTLKYYKNGSWLTFTGQTGVSYKALDETCSMITSNNTTRGIQMNLGKSFKTTSTTGWIIY